MDAVKFLKERERMCRAYKDCGGCPLVGMKCGGVLETFNQVDTKSLVGAVEKWSSAHPLKTRQSVFLSHYPNAEVDGDGVLKVCPKVVEGSGYINSSTCGCMSCATCRKAYWPVEVVENGAKMDGGVDDASV